MFIKIRNELKYIQENIKDEKLTGGTLAVITGSMDFTGPDGFIQFMGLALRQIPVTYGEQDPKWQAWLNKICAAAEKLQANATKFTGTTGEEFCQYCYTLSHVMEEDARPLPAVIFNSETGNNLVPFMKKHAAEGNWRGFYYEPEENAVNGLMEDLMRQLSNLKFEKESARNYDISPYLTRAGYHEHVHDALNIILGTAVYAINCSSTKEQGCYSFDTQKIHNNLQYAESIINSIKNVN